MMWLSALKPDDARALPANCEKKKVENQFRVFRWGYSEDICALLLFEVGLRGEAPGLENASAFFVLFFFFFPPNNCEPH